MNKNDDLQKRIKEIHSKPYVTLTEYEKSLLPNDEIKIMLEALTKGETVKIYKPNDEIEIDIIN